MTTTLHGAPSSLNGCLVVAVAPIPDSLRQRPACIMIAADEGSGTTEYITAYYQYGDMEWSHEYRYSDPDEAVDDFFERAASYRSQA